MPRQRGAYDRPGSIGASIGATATQPTRAIACLLAAAPAALGNTAAADDLVVPRDFGDIQSAITRARVGDRVIVEPGTYDENLRLRSGVDVLGVDTARVVLHARSPSTAAATFDSVTGVSFAGFTIAGGTLGVDVVASSGITIENDVLDGVAGTAVRVDSLSTVLVRNATFNNNAVAIERGSAAAPITANIFAANARTLVATGGATDNRANVSFNCFFRNADTDPAFGTAFQLGDPAFADPGAGDFHLREGSACIDVGGGTDAIDATATDAGAYGGGGADLQPFPVAQATAAARSAAAIDVTWPPNLDYHVTNSVVPGSYRLYYANHSPPLDGTDAGGGTQPSPIEVGNVTAFTLANLAPSVAAPGAPQLLSAEPRQNAALLTWSAVPGATAYRVGFGVGSVDENGIDVGAVTTATVGGLVDGSLYRFAVTARAQAQYSIAVTALDNTQSRHESATSTIAVAPLGDVMAGPRSNELTAIPGPTTPVPNLPDEGCFIATSAFGSTRRAEVAVLRDFRDRYLLPTRAGRAFVAAYYRASPRLSRELDARPAWKPWVRGALAPVVAVALVTVSASAGAKATVAGLLVALAAVRVRRRRGRARGGATSRAARHAALIAAAGVCFCMGGRVADAQPPDDVPATTLVAPRWSIVLDAGNLEPDLDSFELFYGDDKMSSWTAGFAYALRPWFEAGAEIGRARADGMGILAGQGAPGGEVEYTLWPAQAFVKVRGLFRPRQLFVPYIGVGLAAAYYEERIDGQSERTGTSELGAGARVGLELYLNRLDADTHGGYGDGPVKQTYLFLEWQRFSTEQAGAELGGEQWLLGFKFGFGRDTAASNAR
jgi:hypothetical protein